MRKYVPRANLVILVALTFYFWVGMVSDRSARLIVAGRLSGRQHPAAAGRAGYAAVADWVGFYRFRPGHRRRDADHSGQGGCGQPQEARSDRGERGCAVGIGRLPRQAADGADSEPRQRRAFPGKHR